MANRSQPSYPMKQKDPDALLHRGLRCRARLTPPGCLPYPMNDKALHDGRAQMRCNSAPLMGAAFVWS